MLNTTINFKEIGLRKEWRIVHNLDEYGLSIDAAFIGYCARTSHVSVEDFCDYVTSKDKVSLVCVGVEGLVGDIASEDTSGASRKIE